MKKLIEFQNCIYKYEDEQFIDIPDNTNYILKTCYAFKGYEDLEKLFMNILMLVRDPELPPHKTYHFGNIEVKNFKDN